ncbi:hypothetical protein HOL34_02765 [bacterium]|jgi:hypothetical protein|nr:hypothetical protein [bacterium]MBT3903800.1 hypothetical protein [bacterium]MBT4577841.1 hypothetical protein [bacterium]MBT5346237.1 hypothetical protein [bacterium]MBT6131033.1 hypothetical protein [bacterium]
MKKLSILLTIATALLIADSAQAINIGKSIKGAENKIGHVLKGTRRHGHGPVVARKHTTKHTQFSPQQQCLNAANPMTGKTENYNPDTKKANGSAKEYYTAFCNFCAKLKTGKGRKGCFVDAKREMLRQKVRTCHRTCDKLTPNSINSRNCHWNCENHSPKLHRCGDTCIKTFKTKKKLGPCMDKCFQKEDRRKHNHK